MASIVVIGAGVGGMAAAARLSAQGHRVTVFEQGPSYGGKVGGVRRDGFAFDTGPSLLTLLAVYRDLFLKTAVRRRNAALEDNVGLVGLDPAFGYRWADGATATIAGSNTNRVAEDFGAALGGSADKQWRELSRRGAAIWAATRQPFLESPVDGPLSLVRKLHRVQDLRAIAPWRSLRGLGQQFLSDPRLQMVLDRYATYGGSDPRRAPATLAVIPFVEQTFGAWHIEGGIRNLAEALHTRCLERGVNFFFGSRVTDIVVQGGAAVGVRIHGQGVVDADVVVANADAAQVYGSMVTPATGGRARARLRRARPSMSGFVILLALRGRTVGLRHHNVVFPPSYDEEFDAIFGRRPFPPDDPAIYICSPDDDTMRPDPDHEAWFVLVNAPRQVPDEGMDWNAPGLADTYADRILSRLAERGLDVRDRVCWREVRTPATLEQETLSPGGAIYGSASNGMRSAFLRPANQSPVKGLFLVGGSAHPGGGLPLVGMSAVIVASLVGDA